MRVFFFGVEVSHFRSGVAQVLFFVSLSGQGAARFSSSMEAAVILLTVEA